MDHNAKQMIAEIEKRFPIKEQLTIRNVSDLNIDTTLAFTYQYIIGVTHADKQVGYITYDGYKLRIQHLLKDTTLQFACFGWRFEAEDLDEVKEVLAELAEYFNAVLEIDKMIQRLNISKKDSSENYYIVVTIISIPIFKIE